MLYIGNDVEGQLPNFLTGGSSIIHQNQSLSVMYPTISASVTFPACLLNQPTRSQFVRSIFEGVMNNLGVFDITDRNAGASRMGFLKKLPALPNTAGSGNLDLRMRITASATSLWVISGEESALIPIELHRNPCAKARCAPVQMRREQ